MEANNDNYMEALARAYNDKLKDILPADSSIAVAAIEDQLVLLEGLCPARKRLLSYLRSLKQSVYAMLTAERSENIIPSYRSFAPEGGLNKIIDLELDLFIALDTMRSRAENAESAAFLDKIIALETRFSALIGSLR